eukprot:TRINITY_DN87575_c0_g1_i1.p1 TRINITY_DN87575_c0_g1~~TRINITY_DN87575_c0_g1_i1.p1  ORF type:complete len:269 (-),score=25.65 TRINITY_DN87575_c0_g1_i1:293-1099(-)
MGIHFSSPCKPGQASLSTLVAISGVAAVSMLVCHLQRNRLWGARIIDDCCLSNDLGTDAISEMHLVKAENVLTNRTRMTEQPQHQAEIKCWTEAIVRAATEGKLDEVREMLGPGNESGLISSCKLLSQQAELPATGWIGITAVGAAALRGHAQVIELLVQAKADLDGECHHETSSINASGSFSISSRETPLCIVARQGHVACARVLVGAQADPNVRCGSEFLEGSVEWSEEGDDGSERTQYTALDMAEQARHARMIELLLECGGTRLS